MFVVFLLLWILLNGRVTMEIVILGAIFSAAFDLFARKYLGRTLKGDLKWLRRAPLLAKYLIVLLFEIVKANRDVIRMVLCPQPGG